MTKTLKIKSTFNEATRAATAEQASRLRLLGYCVMSHGYESVVVKVEGGPVSIPHDRINDFLQANPAPHIQGE